VKALIILFLIILVFGSGAYWTYELFVRPHKELKEEKLLPPEPPPPDPSLPEFEKAVALHKQGQLLEARTAFQEFLAHNPSSTVLDKAREHLGEINTDITLSTRPAPEKEVYVVKSGDVLGRVASRMRTTPELIMRSNNLSDTMLRIGQKLTITPAEFSLVISKKDRKVTVLNKGEFFKQYPILSMPHHAAPPASAKKGPARPEPKITGSITEKIAWSPEGIRVAFGDKAYPHATHWIVNVAGHTLYSDPGPNPPPNAHVNKPPSGLGLSPEHMEELAALLSKGNPVTIEN
jgi:LysM repeat protein